ncbi:MAG: hypothetical protein GWP08_18540, partial [Nitrospiraceae bacterium]|nr:hypothetical protein [Nitrospiraceae bacterium]
TILRRAHMVPVLDSFSCSSVAVWGPVTADGHLLQTRDLDWSLEARAHDFPCIVVYIPTTGVPHANITFAGMVGCHTGINLAGIVLAEMGDSPSSDEPYNLNGAHFMSIMREILYDARSLEGALDVLRNTTRIKKYHYVIGDGRYENRAAKVKAHAPDDIVYWYDNESDDPSSHRFPGVVYNDEGRGAGLLVAAQYGSHTPETMQAIANALAIHGSNVVNVVYDAETLECWVAYAKYSETESRNMEAFERPYLYLDLDNYLP